MRMTGEEFEFVANRTISVERAKDELRAMVLDHCSKRNLEAPARMSVHSLDGAPINDIVDGTRYKVLLVYEP